MRHASLCALPLPDQPVHASSVPHHVLGAWARLRRAMARFARANAGATMTEYALLAGFVAVVALAGAKALGVNLSTKFGNEAARVATP